jgi:hypothetical protein
MKARVFPRSCATTSLWGTNPIRMHSIQSLAPYCAVFNGTGVSGWHDGAADEEIRVDIDLSFLWRMLDHTFGSAKES